MNGKDMLHELQHLDEDLIEKHSEPPHRKKPSRPPWQRWGALAAAAAILAGAGYAGTHWTTNPAGESSLQAANGSGASDAAIFGSGDREVQLLSAAKLPDIPDKPNLDDYLTEDTSDEDWDKAWDAYNEKQEAYNSAMKKLKGKKPSKQYLKSLHTFTEGSVKSILSGAEANKNVIYSPANLYLALTMLTESADGNTRQQLLDLLGVTDTETMREQTDRIWRTLYRKTETGTTTLANSLWMNNSFSFNQKTTDRLAKDYHASTYRAQMGTEETNKAIADWVNENTGNLLSDKTAQIDSSGAEALLYSTLYFYDQWMDEFNETNTHEDIFTASDKSEQKTDFMGATRRGNFVKGDDFTAAYLPFMSGGNMVFVLPDEDSDIQSILDDPQALNLLINNDVKEDNLSTGDIVWSLPKFDIEGTQDLKQCLTALGVTDVFDVQNANFSALSSDPLYVSRITQSARVKIDEKGCEAAAYTEIAMSKTAFDPNEYPTIEMNLNRPFLFAITGEDNLPLFVGIVNSVG